MFFVSIGLIKIYKTEVFGFDRIVTIKIRQKTIIKLYSNSQELQDCRAWLVTHLKEKN